MSTLEGKSVADSFKDLLQVSNNNIGIDNVVRSVEDGEGTQSALALSTSTIEIRGSIIPSTNSSFDIGSAEYKIRHLFLSDNSLYVGDQQFSSQDVQEVKNLRNGAYATANQGNLAESALQPGSFNFDDLGNKPTTLTGYGITDAATAAQGAVAHQALETANVALKPGGVSFITDVTDRPVTLDGYGIIDGATKTYVDNSVAGIGSDSWSDIENKPTTLAGFGITDAATSTQGTKADTALQPGQAATLAQGAKADTALQPGNHINFVDVIGRPSTLFGYGITDGATTTYVDNAIVSSQGSSDWANITSTPNTLFGYGITDAATLTQGVKADSALQPGQAATITQGEKADTALQPNTAIHANSIHLSSGAIFGPSTTYIDPEGIGDNTGRLVILGDLEVRGTTTQLDSQSLELGLTTLNLAASAEADSQIDGSGIVLGNDLKSLIYSTSQSAWITDQNFSSTSTIKGNSIEVAGAGIFGWQDNVNCVMHYGAYFGWSLFIDNEATIHVKDTNSQTPYYTGMGTITPESRLHVQNHHSDASVNVATFESSIDGSASISLKSVNSWETSIKSNDDFTFTNSVGNLVHFGSDGFVGVGATSRFVAGSIMEIHGDGKQLVLKDPDGPYMMHTASSGEIAAFNTNMTVGTTTSQNLNLMTGGNVVATVTPTRNFGIGTTSPVSKLSVHESGSAQIAEFKSTSSTQGGYIKISGGSTSGSTGDVFLGNAGPLVIGADIADGAIRTASDLIIATGGALERLRVTSTGNVGIGTTAPAHKLHVSNGDIRIDNTNKFFVGNEYTYLSSTITNDLIVSSNGDVKFSSWSNAVETEHMTIKEMGNVGIGTTTPTKILSVQEEISGGISLSSFSNAASDADSIAGIDFESNEGESIRPRARISSGADGSNAGYLALHTRTAGSVEERMRINNSGRVGIGTSSPILDLDVYGIGKDIGVSSTHADGTRIYHSVLGTDGDGNGIIGLYNDVGNKKVHISSKDNESSYIKSGNVGIGTSTPSTDLHITTQNAGDATILLEGNNGMLRIDQNSIRTLSSTALNIFTHPTDATKGISIDTNGRLGVGIPSPEQEVHIKASSDSPQCTLVLQGGSTVNYCSGILFQNSDQTSNGAIYYNASDNFMRFNVGGLAQSTERMRLTNLGFLGVGTTDITNRLEVAGNAHFKKTQVDGGDSAISLYVGGAADHPYLLIKDKDGSTGTKLAGSSAVNSYIECNRLGINTTTPEYALHVKDHNSTNTVVKVEGSSTSDGWQSYIFATSPSNRHSLIGAYKSPNATTSCGILYTSRTIGTIDYKWTDDAGVYRTSTNPGDIGTTGGVAIGSQTSDERFKNIESTFEYGLDHVLQLKPIAYSSIGDPTDTRKLGFGAQTTQPIIPEAVFDTKECVDGYIQTDDIETQIPQSEDTKLGMEYVQLVPVLTKAIQDQQQIIESLKSRIEALENK